MTDTLVTTQTVANTVTSDAATTVVEDNTAIEVITAGTQGPSGVSRVATITSDSVPTLDTDLYDAITITAQSEDIADFSTNLTGTPTDFQKLLVRITSDGGTYNINFGSAFANGSKALPTSLGTATLLVLFIYDAIADLWLCEATGPRV